MDLFKDVLKDLIIDKNISLRKLALESNVSAMQYSKYLKGSYPNIEVAVRIANYFECSLDYLFGLTDKKKYMKNNYDLDVFIERYENLLNQANISHWKFSKQVNISESCLRHWKYGEVPKTETLIIIATNLYCSIDYLIGRE